MDSSLHFLCYGWVTNTLILINGIIPEEFYNLKFLLSVFLNSGYITGTISNNICKLRIVMQLYLENPLQGTLPHCICNLKNLKELTFGNNEFSSNNSFI